MGWSCITINICQTLVTYFDLFFSNHAHLMKTTHMVIGNYYLEENDIIIHDLYVHVHVIVVFLQRMEFVLREGCMYF